MTKHLVETGFELTMRIVSYLHDSPVIGAYETRDVLHQTYGPFPTKDKAEQEKALLKRSYSRRGWRVWKTNRNAMYREGSSLEILFSIDQVEVSREEIIG